MGQHVTKTDFEWVYDEEPHKTRRAEILKKYPEIKELFGHDPNLKWICIVLVLVQITSLHYLQDKSWWILTVAAYCFGGVINHILTFAIHETSHNLAFEHGRIMANRFFGMFCNLPLVLPASATFKNYHLEHHRYPADEYLDRDVPMHYEAKFFCTTFRKLCWVFLHIFLYINRTFMINPKAPTKLEYVNLVIQMAFNAIIVKCFGWKMIAYLLLGTILVAGLHPIAGHFIAEHCMFIKGIETYSYYGPLNAITWNAGYHNEHHDFPSIPGSRLPMVTKIAPEFYDYLPHHDSWIKVIYDFITDPAIGPHSRVKRKGRDLAN